PLLVAVGEDHVALGLAQARMALRRLIDAPPHQHPREAEYTSDEECGAPASEPVLQADHDNGRERGADRRSAVEHRYGETAFAAREPFADGLCRTGPVRRFAEAEQKSQREQRPQARGQRCERGGDGIPRHAEAQAVARAHAIEKFPRASLAECVSQTEADHYDGEGLVVPVEAGLQSGRQHGQRLPVDVIDDGGGQQQPADPPPQPGYGADPAVGYGRRTHLANEGYRKKKKESIEQARIYWRFP